MEMLKMFWEFLNTNKEALGTLIGIIEGIVVLINMWKKFRSGEISTSATPPSFLKKCLWIVNPVNVFKKA